MLRVAFLKLYICSSPTIGMFLYVAQAIENVFSVPSVTTQHPQKTDNLATGLIGISNLRSREAIIWGTPFPPSVRTLYHT